MQAVGIKELKAKLSEYVRAARAGETILVTDRSQVVAALGPASDRIAEFQPSDRQARLAELERLGDITLPTASRAGWEWKPKGLGLSKQEIDELLDDMRRDSFEP